MSKLVSVSLPLNQDQCVQGFLHHLSLAVSFLEATHHDISGVIEEIDQTPDLSDHFKAFGGMVAHDAFQTFEFDNNDGDDIEAMILTPDNVGELHDLLAKELGEENQ